ncbi:MAG: outer membrane protein assembly factor BamD [Prolixibacteraceae bacterium]|nr:outer membrane protein assembly factor BamD [Prolixibacteraceae bacterium]MBN2649157.1 outer membrane protein assembly factor BamD [Prolixibacteraceae bacterium]
MVKNWFYILVVSLFLVACSDYNMVVKSTDYEYKYKKALEYYEEGDYVHANYLFQDLVYVFRGTSRGDELYFNYAKSLLAQRDFVLAGHFFKSIVDQYPRSRHAEEAYFMVGQCYYEESPTAKLDQNMTRKAIDALQLYINLYPYGERVDEANILIDEMNEKIAYKSYLNARLYYDMDYYKAAVISLENSLKDYPDTKYREDLRYLLFKAKYDLAVNSVEDKKRERLIDARDEYFYFEDEFSDSKHFREVRRNFEHVSDLLGYDEDTSMLD